MEQKDFFTTGELAKLLGISRVAVFKRIKNGSIKAKKIGRNFVILKKDIGEGRPFLSELFRFAKEWVISGREIPEQLYCQRSDMFQSRLVKMENLMLRNKIPEDFTSRVVSIAGEIGNNSFDHNLAQWPSVPGIFFGFDLNKKQIILADKGLGILKTLKRVKPQISDHRQALKTAFTEIISGRAPEARGNGLKYVRSVISKNNISLIFQTGNAKLKLTGKSADLNIEETRENVQGCLAFISW